MTITDNAPATTTDAPELIHTLTVAYSDAFRGIAAVLPHAAGTKEFNAVIVAVQVTPAHFIATDRYTVGRYAHNAPIHPDTESTVIPRAAAEWLTKQTPKMLNRDAGYIARAGRVTFTAESITIDADGETLAVTTFGKVGGMVPPVARLVDGWKAATDAVPTMLAGHHLSKFATSATKLAPRASDVEPLTIEWGANDYSPTKPGAVRITIGKRFDGLIQPNLILR